MIRRIGSDRDSGASTLTLAALDIYEHYLLSTTVAGRTGLVNDIEKVSRRISESQPSMSSIRSITNLVSAHAQSCPKSLKPRQVKNQLLRLTRRLRLQVSNAKNIVAKHALPLIPRRATVLTHSSSSTVLEAIRLAYHVKRLSNVIVTESRPRLEGRALAKMLSKEGIPVTLIVDAAVGFFVSKADLALVGADAVLGDGAVVNKVGTYLLALACHEQGVPFYVLCDSFKIDREASSMKPLTIEEKPREEVLEEEYDVDVKNIYFETTPSKYISGIVTQRGVFKPSEILKALEH